MAETTYRALRAKVQKLAYSVARDGEAIRQVGQRADQNARRVAYVADQLAALEVDTLTTGEAKDVSRIMRGVSTAAIASASAADSVGAAARGVDAQAQKSHGAIDEQVGAMTVRMARASFYEQE
ncbi:hypothetical protein ACIQWR_38985 [Streptomyces sp. NPDC098789]|uniref:hypothetical protein n=1 Tax=Streptomyces sp. NPDC098789 TaxID=3366098 RepID=UPI003813AE3D